MHAIPGGPFTREKPLPEAIIKALNEKYHLDDPIWKQYLDYWKDILRGDLGPSFQLANYTVNDLIAKGFPIAASPLSTTWEPIPRLWILNSTMLLKRVA